MRYDLQIRQIANVPGLPGCRENQLLCGIDIESNLNALPVI
jgi:hypothetical protein